MTAIRKTAKAATVAPFSVDDHLADEIHLASLAERYLVATEDHCRMWHDLALLLARRYESSFRIPWHEGDPSKRRPGKKVKRDVQLLNAANLISQVEGIQKRAGWTKLDLAGKKTAGIQLSLRKASLVVALLQKRPKREGKAITEEKAVTMVLENSIPPNLPDVWRRYQHAKALYKKFVSAAQRDKRWKSIGLV